ARVRRQGGRRRGRCRYQPGTRAMSAALRTDAGVTILELVVALGILAGLLVAVSGSIPRHAPAAETPSPATAVAKARVRAILSGQAQVLHTDGAIIVFTATGTNWSATASAPP